MIEIILLEPETAGNVGAIARAMKNFGFNKLVIINPHCDHLSEESRNRAKHAQNVLENAEVQEYFIVDAYDYLIATTARTGTDYNISRSPLSPSELSEKVKKIHPKKKIGLVIGREGHGLFNEEIERCDFVVTIPGSKEYPTLNISHAVTIILYELHKSLARDTSTSHINPIGKSEKDQIARMFDEIFLKMEWETEDKKETQRKLWKRILGKSMLTNREAYGVMGFLRKVIRIQEGKGKRHLLTSEKGKSHSEDKNKTIHKGSMTKRPSARKDTSVSKAKAERVGSAKASRDRAKSAGAGKQNKAEHPVKNTTKKPAPKKPTVNKSTVKKPKSTAKKRSSALPSKKPKQTRSHKG